MAINKATSGAIYGKSTSTTMTDEPTTSAAGNIYQITSSLHQVIDPTTLPTLNTSSATYLDTTWMDGGWDYFTGRVKLMLATSPTVTGKWITMTALGSVVSWSLAPNKTVQETTAIGDTWKQHTQIENGVNFTMNRYFVDTDFWTHVTAGSPILIKIWEDAVTGFWLKGFVTSFGATMSVGKVDDEAITMQVSGPISRF